MRKTEKFIVTELKRTIPLEVVHEHVHLQKQIVCTHKIIFGTGKNNLMYDKGKFIQMACPLDNKIYWWEKKSERFIKTLNCFSEVDVEP